ncbi:Kelch repeat-containing protein [Stigmatella aurantiaca]|nr:kelch repeat-containing protein [Stigmatella aurantiaca]ADO75496.1 Kelch domain protein [Stigmatella aurantiaca DW4/3-1]
MRNVSTRLLLALGLALLAGCSPTPSTSGSARLAVSTRKAVTSVPSGISRVTVTSSAEDMSPLPVELKLANGVWGGIIGDIPAGSDRTFQAQAFDSWGNLRFEGTASGITIGAGQSSLVAITLQEVNAPPPYINESPLIDSLVVSSSTVLAGDTLLLEATAHDPNESDSFWYSWSATGGYFFSDYNHTTAWQAPSSSGVYRLTLTVTDSAGTSSSISLEVVVHGGAEGSAEITISFNGSPGVSSVRASRSPLEVGQTTTVSAAASDLDGDTLSYAWSANCEGSWEDASSSTAQFTPTALPPGVCNNCHLTVTVSDDKGGQTTGTVALCVNTPSTGSHSPPSIARSYRSSDTASANQVLTYAVVASDPEGSALSFSWTANSGTLGTAASGPFNSSITWKAPLCAGVGVSPAITATVINAFGMTATRSFPITGLPTCAPGTWASTGALSTARQYATATLLPNGKVLVAGGYHSTYSYTYLATAELYDPATGTWSPAGAMASPRYQHTATLLPNGKVLVVGGYAGSSGALATAELYDPATGTWSQTSTMASTRYNHLATLLAHGKVLIAGGNGGSSGTLTKAELYDPATGTWSPTGSMTTSRQYATATLLPDGKVLVAGGSGYYSGLTAAELYDPATGTWRAARSMVSPRYNHSATLLPNGKVLVAGGYNYDPMATAEVYDPSTDKWSTTGSMISPRSSQTATLLPSGKVLAVGGASYYANQTTAEVYDPSTSTWSIAVPMTVPRSSHTATLLSNGDVLIAGGYSYWDGTLKAAELFKP